MKNKNVAGILAFTTGMLGVHRFYLGQKSLGVVYFLATFIGIMITAASDGDAPLILAPLAIAFIDSILFFVMHTEEFDKKYNVEQGSSKRTAQPRRFRTEGYVKTKYAGRRPAARKAVDDPHKRMGIERFRDFDYLGAIESFQKSLNQNYESASTHFNLACSYSMLELPKDAFFHLEKAVEFGFDAFQKIESHQALAYLRTHPDFNTFVKNEYKVISALAPPILDLEQLESNGITTEEPIETLELKDPEPLSASPDNLLDQLLALGELKEKGLLTAEEFNAQKQKLLRD
ncbi:MAG: hypothetical protein Sapg2KO_47650 [Saprospiraceae bacterium]